MSVELVALDIDGTLLAPGVAADAVPETDVCEVVQELVSLGVHVVLATGRMFPGAAYIADALSLRQPVICQQGATVHTPDGEILEHHEINARVAHALYDFAIEQDYGLAWFDAKRYLVTQECGQTEFFAAVSRVAAEAVEDPRQSGVRPTGVDIISSRRDAAKVHEQLEARFGRDCTLLDFPSVTAVHSSAASKGRAVADLAEQWGVRRDRVLAIGDSVNDVSMLSWAGQSVTPEHADHYAKGAAEVVPGRGTAGVVARLRAAAEAVAKAARGS